MKNVMRLISLLALSSGTYAFSPLPSLTTERSGASQEQPPMSCVGTCSTITTTLMAGFGSPSGGGKKKKEKEQKLKPKQQWDRYNNLKKEPMVRVAVRVEGDDENNDWLEVGRVKSKGNFSTVAAVAKQRVIIAEHSRRIYPLQVSKDSKVQWAYWQEEGEQWFVVDKSVLDGSADGIEKEVGFEGRPDPASGFYCMYKGGRLVDTSTDGKAI